MDKILNHSYVRVYIRCHEAAYKLGLKIKSEDLKKGNITFRTKASLLSFGEFIDVSIEKVSASETKISVTSGSSFSVQMYDWGKSQENVKSFLLALNELLNRENNYILQ